MKSSAIIELKNVCKSYKMGEVGVKAVCDMSLKIDKGNFVAIMGPSGSGKSTTMNMVGCLDVPTEGSIFLENRNIAHLSESQLAQIRGKKIGFIFQQFNLIPTLTAVENVMLPMMFQNTDESHRKKRAISLLKLVDLEARMDHLPRELSGGEQQRVAIARALANDPEVILADEPTGNLDSKTGQTIVEFLKKLHKTEKKTIIVVTHDENIAKHAEKIVYLHDGKIIKIKKNKVGI